MSHTYDQTRRRLETYFDQTAAKNWEALTSDAPVSRVRQTVREGRDAMRATLLSRLPADLSGARVLDAGCGAGQITEELARRGARVIAADISPNLLDVAARRIPEALHKQITFVAGDMLNRDHGAFDYVVAMDSLIHYEADDIGRAMACLTDRTDGAILFTVAPRTPALTVMWWTGKAFPRSDRSPQIIPHSELALLTALDQHGVRWRLSTIDRISRGFYISQAMELCP